MVREILAFIESDTPLLRKQGVLPSTMRLAPEYRYSDVEARMSRSVHRTEVLLVPVCPTVPAKPSVHPLKDTIRPLGKNALSKEILRWLFHSFLVNTVVFLPLTLRQRTHRNAIQLSRYCRKYSTLIHVCQAGRLLTWQRNQNTRQCGLPRKIWKPLHAFGNSTGVSPIQRLFDWLCKSWQGKSRLPTHQFPQGRPIHPRP